MKNRRKIKRPLPSLVSLKPHPRCAEVTKRLARCRPTAFAGKFIRVTGMRYANERDLLTGEGSLKYGGRYSGKHAFRAIYGSLELDTATAELLAHHRRQGRPDPEAAEFPFVAVSLGVKVERLLDLTDPTAREA